MRAKTAGLSKRGTQSQSMDPSWLSSDAEEQSDRRPYAAMGRLRCDSTAVLPAAPASSPAAQVAPSAYRPRCLTCSRGGADRPAVAAHLQQVAAHGHLTPPPRVV